MNLTIMLIIFIIGTVLTDFLTYKKDEETELSHQKSKRVIKNFINNAFTYIAFTLVLSLIFKYFLISNAQVSDNTSPSLTNTLIGAIFLGVQVLSIYSFYDNYIYSYRFLSSNFKLIEKILIFLLGVVTILINEFVLSNINLGIISFDLSILNLLPKIILYSTYIFIPLLIILREIDNHLKNIEEF